MHDADGHIRSTAPHAAPTHCNQLHLHILGSGSKGNCALVEGPGGFIMIDAGFSRRETLRRMHELDLDEERVQALIITHEHGDHVKGAAVWCKRFGGSLHASLGTPGTRDALAALPFEEFAPGGSFVVAGIHVQTFPTVHDVLNPVGLRFDCSGDSIGFATDTGILTPGSLTYLRDVRILALESNHDVALLRTGPYPRYLQDRIISERGHLSNAQAAEALPNLVTERTEQLIAMHISQENNRPSLAVRAWAAALGAELDDELGSAATLERTGAPALHIRAAGQNRPITIF